MNDPGASNLARIVRGGALHHSQGESTTRHAHYAWKVHVGIDAPVWLESERCMVPAAAGARVVIAPPGVLHSTGAIGWSCAIFVAPGTRGTPWAPTSAASALGGDAAARLVEACRQFALAARADTPDFIDELSRLVLPRASAASALDRRVQGALVRLRGDADCSLDEVAREARLSLNRLSRLVTEGTGMRLRQHVLWNRLLAMLSSTRAFDGIAAAACAAGFADHAHLTRTFRAFLGRAPSELGGRLDVFEPW